MDVADIGEQDRRVGGLHRRQADVGLPDAIAGGLLFGHGEADEVIVIAFEHLPVHPIRRAPGRGGGAYGQHRLRPAPVFGQQPVVGTQADIADAVAGGLLLRDRRGRAAGAAFLEDGLARQVGHIQVQGQARTHAPARGQVVGEGVRLDVLDGDIAQEDRIQRQESVEGDLLAVIARVGEAVFDGEATTEQGCLLLLDVVHAAPRGLFGLLRLGGAAGITLPARWRGRGTGRQWRR
ncbi:hypothetical protein D3C71_1164650 [compost metagenome]